MKYLEKQQPHISESRRPGALEHTALGKMPAEVLQLIIQDLPAPTAAAISICCKQISRLLGNQYTRKLALNASDMMVFLRVLARDLLGHRVCRSCHKLYDVEKTRKIHHPWLSCPPIKMSCLIV